jgi:STE24 endopeptidase
MVIIASLFGNVLISLIFVFFVNRLLKKLKKKAVYLIRYAFNVKILIYIFSVILFSLYIKNKYIFSMNYLFLVSIVIFLYILVLVLIDSAIFFKSIKNIDNSSISFKIHLKRNLKETLTLIIPAVFSVFLRSLTYRLGNSSYHIFIYMSFIVVYNFAYPYIVMWKLPKSTESILIDQVELNINNYKIRVYEGKNSKEANAIVCGFVGYYIIFISDYLLEKLTTLELRAILFHEVGHIKKHHLLIKNLFLMALFPLMVSIGTLMDYFELKFMSINKVFGILLMFMTIFLYLGIVFMYISRKQEFEADKYSIKLGVNKSDLISALLKLEKLNFLSSDKKKLDELLSSHPTIKKRVEKIELL